MKRQDYSSSSKSGDVVVMNNEDIMTRRAFQGLINAISQIQQYSVIEKGGQDIPDDFLTIRGKLMFFNIGFGNGFLEGMIFAVLTALIIPVMADPALREKCAGYFPWIKSDIFLWIVNCIPIIVMAAICSYLSKYRIGIITKKAVDSLLIGRLISMIIKGTIICTILIVLGTHITSESAWKFAYGISLKHHDIAMTIYRITMNAKPLLISSAWEILGVFFIATVTPFVTVWAVSLYRKIKETRAKAFWEG
jgi:hypothetical protein